LYFDFYFGQKSTDVRLILDLEHEFEIDGIFSKKDYVVLKPTFTTFANSLNFYSLYLKNKEKNQHEIILP